MPTIYCTDIKDEGTLTLTTLVSTHLWHICQLLHGKISIAPFKWHISRLLPFTDLKSQKLLPYYEQHKHVTQSWDEKQQHKTCNAQDDELCVALRSYIVQGNNIIRIIISIVHLGWRIVNEAAANPRTQSSSWVTGMYTSIRCHVHTVRLFIYLLRPWHRSSQWCRIIFRFHVGCRCCFAQAGHSKQKTHFYCNILDAFWRILWSPIRFCLATGPFMEIFLHFLLICRGHTFKNVLEINPFVSFFTLNPTEYIQLASGKTQFTTKDK